MAHLTEAFSNTTETFLYESLLALEEVGCAGTVLTYRRRQIEARPFPRIVSLSSRPRAVGWLERAEDLGLAPVGARYWPLRRDLRRALRRCRARCVHAHFGPMGALAAPVARELGIPLFVSFYGYDVGEVDPGLYQPLWPVLRGAFALSEQMAASLVEFGCPRELIAVVRLGRRLADFPWRPRTPPLRRFVSVGRLTDKKGHDIALRALKLLAPEYPQLRLDVYGGGPAAGRLGELVAELGLEDRATLHGGVPAELVPPALARADGFLLASRRSSSGDREGTPTAIIEAQACGLIVVSTRHAGIPEIVPTQSHDLLAAEGSVTDLARAWRGALELGATELEVRSLAGRALVEAQHDVLREARRVRARYLSAVGPSSSRQR